MGVGDGGIPIMLVGEDSEVNDLRAKYCSRKKGITICSLTDKLKTNSYADEDFYILFSFLQLELFCVKLQPHTSIILSCF